MSRLRVESFSISVDGFGAGPNQDLANPLGSGGMDLHKWAFSTRTFQQKVFGNEGGATGVDDDYAKRGFRNVGAWILGRNMFGPVRGPWPDDAWKGWWGDEPPYQVPVFVLTHHARSSINMKGGTVFHFVTSGIHEARKLAIAAAGSQDVRVGGGVATFDCSGDGFDDKVGLQAEGFKGFLRGQRTCGGNERRGREDSPGQQAWAVA